MGACQTPKLAASFLINQSPAVYGGAKSQDESERL